MARGISENDVWEACDALLLEGARPTIERVRQKIGSGSPNTVSPLLDGWFKRLGSRIKDPKAFAPPPLAPDPILRAAKHFWEVALAETRSDFDIRLHEALASAIANVEAQKEAAARANAAAFEATSKLTHLQAALEDRSDKLDRTRQELSAERARLAELRARQVEFAEILRSQEERTSVESNDLRQQLLAAVKRADAADRRVAMELERERTARGKAERHAESLQKGLDAARDTIMAANETTRLHLGAARDREENLRVQLATTASALDIERERSAQLRVSLDARDCDVGTARSQVEGLQGSIARLTALVTVGTQRTPMLARKRSKKAMPASGT